MSQSIFETLGSFLYNTWPYFLGIIIAVALAVIFGFIAKSIAAKKGNKGFLWGFLLGIIGIIIVSLQPESSTYQNPVNNQNEIYTSYNSKNSNCALDYDSNAVQKSIMNNTLSQSMNNDVSSCYVSQHTSAPKETLNETNNNTLKVFYCTNCRKVYAALNNSDAICPDCNSSMFYAGLTAEKYKSLSRDQRKALKLKWFIPSL